MKSRHTRGIVFICVGIVAAITGAVPLLSVARLDSSEMFQAPLWVLGGVILVIVGLARLRGKNRG